MPDNALTATILGAMREHWALEGTSDHLLEPHARRLVGEVRAGLSHESLVADLSETFFVKLKRPIGNKYRIEQLATRIRALVHQSDSAS